MREGGGGGYYIPDTLCVLGQQPSAPVDARPRPVEPGFDQHLGAVARDVDRHEAETNHVAEPMHASIAIPAAPRGRYRQPCFVGGPGSVDRLQQQLQAETKLHLHHGQGGRIAIPNRDDVTGRQPPF